MPTSGSTCTVRIFSGVCSRDLLDVHAALGRAEDRDVLRGAVDEEREVELAVDLRARLDVEPLHDLALGAGLLGDEPHADHVGRGLLRLLGRLHDLDAAGLAAAARVHLRLHHDGAADVARGLLGLGRRQREPPGRNLDAVLAQAAPSPDTRGRSWGVSLSQSLMSATSFFTWSIDFATSRLLVGQQLELEDLLHAARAEQHGHAHVDAARAVLAVEVRGAGEHALLIAQDRLGHRRPTPPRARRTPSPS